MEPLILKVQADTQGVPESFNRIVQSQEGMNISSRKASGALKGFVQDLAQARDGADVASAALGAFSKILGTSLAATGVVIAGKVLIDSFQKVSDSVNKAKDAFSAAKEEMARMGPVTGLSDGVTQANLLYKAASDAEKSIKDIEKSSLQNFIAEIRGAKKELLETSIAAKTLADSVKLQGIQRQAAQLSIEAGLTEEDKLLRKIGEKYEGLIKAAMEVGDESTVSGLRSVSQKEQQDALKKFRLEKKAEEDKKRNAEELDLQNKQFLEDQKYGDLKRKLDMEEYQRGLDRQSEKNAQESKDFFERIKKGESLKKESVALQEKQLDAQDRVNKAREELVRADGEVAKILAAGTGSGRGIGQRKSSLEIGIEKAMERGAEKTRKAEINLQRSRIANELKRAGKVSDSYAVDREVRRRAEASARQAAQAPFTAQEEAQKNLESAESYLSSINGLLETTLQELKTYAHVK